MFNLAIITATALLVTHAIAYHRWYKNSRKSYGRDSVPNYNTTFFGWLENQISKNPKPEEIAETEVPYLARVVPSSLWRYPTLCNAVCVEPRIFITAARCLFGLTIGEDLTSVYYKDVYHPVIAIVLPDKTQETKQHFDDIGFLVVNDAQADFEPIEFNGIGVDRRTDSDFQWFAKLNTEGLPLQHVLVALHDEKKGGAPITVALRLQVILAIELCSRLYSPPRNSNETSFFVPCVYPCTLPEYDQNDTKCEASITKIGAPVINTLTNKLVGVATWGHTPDKQKYKSMPVGIAITNSDAFYENLKCAQKIKDLRNSSDVKYQALCSGYKL